MAKEELLARLRAVILGESRVEEVEDAARVIVDAGVDLNAAIDVATEAIRAVGDRFEAGDIYLPELMIAGRKMERCMAVLRPHIEAGQGRQSRGRIVIGTVSGDIHDIGKNLVANMIAVRGFEITDLGVNVPPLTFVSAARDGGATIIALSSLMTTSLPYQQEVIEVLKEMGLRDKFYVIVGGGPVTAEFAKGIGADGWAENAASAARLCEILMTSREKPPVVKTVIV
ncbi:MAG: cobalamin-dependent protein [Chloroflexi bacterium]|nr:cobalamin-dependent protein [Chloroflexota bacterium]MCL5075934.1 cobalamin-dependent protein [Chloroflexota bacterium]